MSCRGFWRENKPQEEGTDCVNAPRQEEVGLAWIRSNKEANVEARNNNNRNKVANFCRKKKKTKLEKHCQFDN